MPAELPAATVRGELFPETGTSSPRISASETEIDGRTDRPIRPEGKHELDEVSVAGEDGAVFDLHPFTIVQIRKPLRDKLSKAAAHLERPLPSDQRVTGNRIPQQIDEEITRLSSHTTHLDLTAVSSKNIEFR